MDSKIELLVTKRFQTTMIGALYQFEKNFGYLWGIDLDDNQLSPKQWDMREYWEDTRNSILNNGNHQLRKTLDELSKVVGSTKYHYQFHTIKNKEDQ